MASGWKHRGVAGSLVLTVLYYWATFRWIGVVVAKPFFYPASPYYYNSDSWIRPSANGYSTYQQPSIASAPSAAESQNVAVYNGNPNYYGVPGYEDYRSGTSRNGWNDPYLGWKRNNYYDRYYYTGYPSSSAGGSGWKNRNDGASYYYNRRQDAVQPTPTPTPKPVETTTVTTQRPRKKKLFVPNVWG